MPPPTPSLAPSLLPAPPDAKMTIVPANPILQLLANASSNPQFDANSFKSLMELYTAMEDREAEKSFDDAMAAFQAENLVVIKDKRVEVQLKNNAGTMEYNHASLGNMVTTLRPALARYRIVVTWKLEYEKEGGRTIMVCSCELRFRGAKPRLTTMRGEPDTTGLKNSLQSAASALSYLERYTLQMALGVAIVDGDADDDAIATGGADSQSIITPTEDARWQDFIMGMWAHCRSPLQDDALRRDAELGEMEMWNLWDVEGYRNHPGLVGYWYDWLFARFNERNSSWSSLREAAARKKPTPVIFPEDVLQCSPAQIHDACLMMFNALKRDQSR